MGTAGFWFLSPSVFALCVGNFTHYCVCLSVSPSLPSCFLYFVEYQTWGSLHIRQCSTTELHPIRSACFSVFELLGGSFPHVRLCASVSSCRGSDRAALCWVLSFPHLTVAGLLVQGLELAETPASPVLWSSAVCVQQPYNRCLPHGLPQFWMAEGEAGCVPGHRSFLVTLAWWPCGFRWILWAFPFVRHCFESFHSLFIFWI